MSKTFDSMFRKDFRKLPVALVEWRDSTGDSGWAADDEGDPVGVLIIIRSIGYVLLETEETITLCQSIDNAEDDKTDNRLSIQKALVTKRCQLAPVEKELDVDFGFSPG